MTETTARTEPPTTANAPEAKSTDALTPADVMMTVIVAFLAPMFLAASGGDICFARIAAIETVNAYRVRNEAELLTIAQIIAFGLATLGSLSLSLADDISISMTLRLRGNANALNRSAEQHRRALKESRLEAAATARSTAVADGFDEATVTANVAASQKLAAENLVRTQAAPAAPTPVAPAPISAATTMTENQMQAMWAAGMAEVAAEYTASLPHLPPAQRSAATLRAAALSSSANALIAGVDLAPYALPTRVDPRHPRQPR